MNILLSCCAGMSTSIIVEYMLQECKREGKDYNIKTVDQGVIVDELEYADVILLGPQVRHILKRVKKLTNDQIPVDIIKMEDYGDLNGVAILKHAEDLFKNHKIKSNLNSNR